MLYFWRSPRTAATLLSLTLSITVGCSDTTRSLGATDSPDVEAADAAQARNTAVASVTVRIDSVQLGQSHTAQAVAVARDIAGNILSAPRTRRWRSRDNTIATVSDVGVVTAVAPGTTLIRCTIEGISGDASLTVVSLAYRRIASVSVALDSAVLTTPHQARANATIRDSNGSVQSGTVIWRTADPSVATVASDGTVTAVGAGSTTVSGSNESVTGLASITVVASLSQAPALASQLAVTTQPSASVQSGVTFAQQPAVQMRDSAGGAIAQGGVIVTAAIASGTGALGGTLTATTTSLGVATFVNLSITGIVGARTLLFSTPGLANALSTTVTVSAGASSKLAIKTQPSASAVSGSPLAQQPMVQLVDASGNAVSQSGVAVLATIATGPGGTLSGTTSVTSDATGLAKFTNLTLTGAGSYVLQFGASYLSSVTSATIAVSGTLTAPSPSGACANEPTGYTRFHEQPWDAAPIRNVQSPLGWIDDGGNGGSAFSIVSDPTSLFPSTNHNVIAGKFAQGSPGGSAPFYVYKPFGTGEQFRNMYICVYVKHDANFDNTNGNAGTKFLWPAGDQVGGAMTYTSHDGPNMDFAMIQQGPVDRYLGANLNPTAALVVNRRGQWMVYEMLLKANTNNSTANGELHMWIDGVKTHQYANVNWQMGGSRTWQSLAWNPTYGGGLNPVPRDQYQYLDHVRISGYP